MEAITTSTRHQPVQQPPSSAPPIAPVEPPPALATSPAHVETEAEEPAPVGALVFLLAFLIILAAAWGFIYLQLWLRG